MNWSSVAIILAAYVVFIGVAETFLVVLGFILRSLLDE